MGLYITHDNVAKRITWEDLRDIFDDDAEGDWKDALDEAIEDAESVVEQSVAKAYGDAGLTWLHAQDQGCPRAVKRLCLDEFEWRRGHRHPGYTNAMLWEQRRQQINADLKALRLRDVQLDTVGEPEPAQNEGGDVESPTGEEQSPVFIGGMGDFWSPSG